MFTRLAEFRLVQSRRIAPGPRKAVMHRNDNLPGFRRPAAAGERRSPSPALACHWLVRNGRLECRWQVEIEGDAPTGDCDEHQRRTTGQAAGPSSMQPRGCDLALAG
jgi:hypothetical protein